MVFTALGGTHEIGASCLYLNIEGTGLLLDVGQHPDVDGPDGLPNFALLKNHPDWAVDHVFITHAHHDHVGALPVLIQQFPHAQVHMTGATRLLLDVLLPASARLQKRRVREGASTAAPLFSEEDVEAIQYLYQTHDLETPFEVMGYRGHTPVSAAFYHSGHVLGAAGVLLEIGEGDDCKRCFYTSDTNLRSQIIHPGGEYPRPPVDTLIMETTLGADPEAVLTTRKTEEKALGEAIVRVLERGGTVLIPVFALGRAQEMVALIGRFKDRGLIPEEIPMYTTGSMRAIADVYDRTRLTTPRLNPDFEVFGIKQKRLPKSETGTLNRLSEPSIHISASGMMFERTLSNRLAQHLVSDPKHGIFFVGYAKPDAPAAQLLDAHAQGAGTEVVLDRARGPQEVHCDVERFRFSGHSHRRDLLQLVERLQPDRVLLVHGETEARDWMAQNLQHFYPDLEIILPKANTPITL